MDHKMETVEVRLHYHESSLQDARAVLICSERILGMVAQSVL